MSSFLIGAQTVQWTLQQATDHRARLAQERGWSCQGIEIRDWNPGYLWSRSTFLCGQQNYPQLQEDANSRPNDWDYAPDDALGGNATCLRLVGQTLDLNGNPLASCQVRAYVTATGAFSASTVSDAGGNYALMCPAGAVAHFIVATLAGSPDVGGVSDNNLVPS